MVLDHGIKVFLSERFYVRISATSIFIAQDMKEPLQHSHFQPKGHLREGECPGPSMVLEQERLL